MVNSKSMAANIPKVLENLEKGATPQTLEAIQSAWCNTNKCWYAIWEDYNGEIPYWELDAGVHKIQAILKVSLMNLIPNIMERFKSRHFPKNQDEVDKMRTSVMSIKNYIETWFELDEKTTLLYERIIMVLDARKLVLDANVFEKPPTYMPSWSMSSNEFLTMVSEQIQKKREDTQHVVVYNPESTPEMVMPEKRTNASIEAEAGHQEWLNLASDDEEFW